ncbi:MAG: acyltransferase family protein [Bacteroidota bacterium]
MSKRRYDIDWIRVIVFDLLICWHIGLLFVSWGDQVQWDLPIKNNELVDWLIWPMFFIRQWRLPILFLVSGIGTCFALSSKSGKKYLKERFVRLFIPLLAGVLIVVPPQVYLERLAQGVVEVSYIEYFPSTFRGIYPNGNFSWGHLWFLAYLMVMSVIALPIFIYLRNRGKYVFLLAESKIRKSPLYLYLFAIPLVLVELTLEKRFPLTMALVNDWYAFSYYLVCFVTGFFLANLGDMLWNNLRKMRYLSLIMGVCASLAVIHMLTKGEISLWIQILKPLNVWCWILTIFGFSAKYLNCKSKLLTYRNAAVYPIYILHFTITLFLGYLLRESPIHYGFKMLLLLLGTFGIASLLYEYILRRIAILRPLFGIKGIS